MSRSRLKTAPSWLGIALSFCIFPSPGASQAYRPLFHFSPEKNWTNDPNGMVYVNGQFHLFFQYNPFGDEWGHMSWGHAVTTNLYRWRELPVALAEENGVMIFSGSAVVDKANTSGFGRGGVPPVVAIYTGFRPGKQNQNIAFSTDNGQTWTKYRGNPVLDIGSAEFRDPMVFWHEPTHRWIMIVSLATLHKVSFYSSSNLKTWTHLSDFGPAGATNSPNWECPNIFPVRVSDSDKSTKHVLLLGVGDGAPMGGSGTQYFVGDFDGKQFVNANPPSKQLWVDYGADFYAAQTWSDMPPSDSRRILLGWMDNWKYARNLPTRPWRGQMSIPRSLTLKTTPAGLRLTQNPIDELKQLRKHHVEIHERSIAAVNAALNKIGPSETLEMLGDITLGSASNIGLNLRKGPSQQTSAGYDMHQRVLYLDRTHSGQTGFPSFPARHEAPLEPIEGKIRLHILLDRCSVELFGNDGIAAITDLIFPADSGKKVELYSDKPITDIALDVWDLQEP